MATPISVTVVGVLVVWVMPGGRPERPQLIAAGATGVQPSTPVAECAAPTGLDSGDPRWRRKIDNSAIDRIARNSDCQFCSVRFQKSGATRYSPRPTGSWNACSCVAL